MCSPYGRTICVPVQGLRSAGQQRMEGHLPIMNVSVQGSTMAEATMNPMALPRASAHGSWSSHMPVPVQKWPPF